MVVLLTVVRYKKWLSWAGILSMGIFRLSLFFNKKISFYKLMGSGKNGGFSLTPDLQQWAILVTLKDCHATIPETSLTGSYGNFINWWWKFFTVQQWTIVMQPTEGHGKWDGKEPFGKLSRGVAISGPVAVLTRATIRINKAKHFWQNVNVVAKEMSTARGFIYSVGIGEIPWIKQATFSIWQDNESMKQFAYSMQHHKLVIQRTRKENWYSEDMFVRFKILATYGDLPTQVISLIQQQQ